MKTSRPLFGRRVVVTRPGAQLASLAALLEDYGADVVTLPTIRVDPPVDWGPLDETIGRLGEFDWVLFTSVNGVAAFRRRLDRAGLDARALGRARLGAIGPGTAEALARTGLRADIVPREYRAEALLEALRPQVSAGTRILLVRAAEAREVLPRGLEAVGAVVTVVPGYRIARVADGAERVIGLLEARQISAVTFSSSSTVHGFMALLPADRSRHLLSGVVLAAIGPITEATIAEYGLEAQVVARDYTIPALASALAAHFARSAQPGCTD